ncbi:MAG: hypothetical protein K2X93_11335 [Candidatus Obscuribacterales bacterium]|nr:hypothetical protein [Candidatus Obscuribacterales bacterium]
MISLFDLHGQSLKLSLDMHRLRDFIKLMAILLVVMTVSGITEGAHAARRGAWRELGRQASYNRRICHYERALSLYEAALESLRSEHRDADEQYDLELMIAETYRLQKRFADAKQIYDRLEPIIKTGKYPDPLLACRYYTRRADLAFNLARVDDALSDIRAAISVKKKYFYKDAGTVVRQQVYLMKKLREHDHLESWHAEMKEWYPQIQLGTAPKEVVEEYKLGIAQMHKELPKKISEGRLNQAEKLLRLCSDMDYDYARLLEFWSIYFYHCFALRRQAELENAMVDITNVLDYVESNPHLKVRVSRIFSTRLALINVYVAQRKQAEVDAETEKINQLLSGSPLSPLEKEFYTWEAKLRLSMIELRHDRPVTREMSRQIKDATNHLTDLLSKKAFLTPKLEEEIRMAEVRGRMNLIVLYANRGLLDEAEQELLRLPPMNKDPKKDSIPFYRHRLSGPYARLAKVAIEQGQDNRRDTWSKPLASSSPI